MPELSLFRFSAIFITEPLTKTLLATGRPPAGLPAAGSAQGGEAQGRAKARTLTGQDGHFHVAVGHQAPRHPGIPRQGSRKDPRAGQPERPSGRARGQNPRRFPRPPLGDATLRPDSRANGREGDAMSQHRGADPSSPCLSSSPVAHGRVR